MPGKALICWGCRDGKKKKRFLLLGSLAQSEDGVGASLLMAPDSFPLSLGDLGF